MQKLEKGSTHAAGTSSKSIINYLDFLCISASVTPIWVATQEFFQPQLRISRKIIKLMNTTFHTPRFLLTPMSLFMVTHWSALFHSFTAATCSLIFRFIGSHILLFKKTGELQTEDWNGLKWQFFCLFCFLNYSISKVFVKSGSFLVM